MNVTDSANLQTSALLRTITNMESEPPVDLWSRIEAAHGTRVRRRRLRRFLAGGMFSAALVGAVALGGLRVASQMPNGSASIDWQARAQALELQLQALERDHGAVGRTVARYDAGPAATELADIDRRLQAAYEHGKYTNELVPLWKRRSELLDTLIAARREGLTLTSI